VFLKKGSSKKKRHQNKGLFGKSPCQKKCKKYEGEKAFFLFFSFDFFYRVFLPLDWPSNPLPGWELAAFPGRKPRNRILNPAKRQKNQRKVRPEQNKNKQKTEKKSDFLITAELFFLRPQT
jgi:hypothetical protein